MHQRPRDRRGEPRLAWCRLDAEVELVLARGGEHEAGPFQQQPELGFGMRRPDMSHDPPAPIDVLGDLHRRRARGRPHPPHPRHRPSLGHQLVPQLTTPATHRCRSASCGPVDRSMVTEVRSGSRNPTETFRHADESDQVRWLTPEQIDQLDLHPSMRLRLTHALDEAERPYIG